MSKNKQRLGSFVLQCLIEPQKVNTLKISAVKRWKNVLLKIKDSFKSEKQSKFSSFRLNFFPRIVPDNIEMI